MSDLSRLPHDPEGFFGLSEGYDRRDLKRAYGKAIRQFKPDKQPREFQLVRDGYERLEKQLRYGNQQQQLADAASAWTPKADEDKSAAADTFAPRLTPSSNQKKPKPQLTIKQLAVIDPAAAILKLRQKTQRSPPDYYLAAVLADATQGRPTSKYLSNLIEGLTVFPHDPGLIALATDYIKTDVTDSMATKVVEFVAKKIRSPLFYMLTESLWLRLVTTMEFESFSSLLSNCETQIVQSDSAARTAFYLRLLRIAIWVAPLPWVDRIMQGIEAHSAELDYGATNDLELLTEIRQLKELKSTLSNPVRQQLFKAVHLACQTDEVAVVPKIIQILSDLSRDSAAIEQAFPMSESSELSSDDLAWVSLVSRLVYQLDSYTLEASEVPGDRIAAQTAHLLNDLNISLTAVVAGVEKARSRYKQMPMIAWMTLGSIGGTLFLLPIVFLFLSDAVAGITCLLGIITLFTVLLVSFYSWLYPKFLHPKLERQQHRWLVRAYAKHWRRRLFRFAQSDNENIQVQSARIEAVGARMGKPEVSNLALHFIRQDIGLSIFATIRTVLR